MLKLYQPGFHYKKVGLCFDELVPKSHQQLDFLNFPTQESLHQRNHLMNVIDNINKKFGRNTLKLATEGFTKSCAMKASMRSSHYTTQWAELPVIKTQQCVYIN